MTKEEVLIGRFPVPVTEKRELFEQTHEQTSFGLPIDQQFCRDEQERMLLHCHEVPTTGATKQDFAMREDDLCELMHYLALQGVPIPQVHAKVRTFSPQTRRLAVRIAIEQRDAVKFDARPLFLAPAVPVLAEAVAS